MKSRMIEWNRALLKSLKHDNNVVQVVMPDELIVWAGRKRSSHRFVSVAMCLAEVWFE